MTEPRSNFNDLAGKKFSITEGFGKAGIYDCLVFERGTRSFGSRLYKAGYLDYHDIEDKRVGEILDEVPTTRRNFERVLYYFQAAGITLT